ncbi:hypothetical protein [Nostoc sp. TCL26-01]|uniref:hypothetical protein n=1 Tax=Nostoc sp. TCL26-01 TaxID=2576904 RepID=UPI002117C109|nr:hypothetical protein [Nostoc sp. TCL26-01]
MAIALFLPFIAKLKNNPYFLQRRFMTSATNPATELTPFPDHTQLPESDGTFVKMKSLV